MFYVFYGPDELSRSEALAELRARTGDPGLADLNTTRLDGTGLSLGQLQEACAAVPFLAPRRLVIVTNYLTQLGRRSRGARGGADAANADHPPALQALADFLLHLPTTLDLVFVESESQDEDAPRRKPVVNPEHMIVQLAAKHPDQGCARAFDLPRSGASLTDWIVQRARSKGARIEVPAAELLGAATGDDDLRLIDAELEKLITYVGGEQPVITTSHVQRLVPYTGQTNVFVMVDAIGQRDARRALRALHQLLDEHPKRADYPLQLLGMIVRHFRILLQVKELEPRQLAASTVANKIGERYYFVVEKAQRQAKNFSMSQLEAIYAQLLATDLAIKTGQMDGMLALDTLIAALCGA